MDSRIQTAEAGGLPEDAHRWEVGSDFDITFEVGSATYPWTAHPHSLWGSGRDAVRGLLEWGARERDWRRLLMPSYFCQDVIRAVRRSIDVGVYPWSPLDVEHEPIVAVDGDVVLISAIFGVTPIIDVRGSAPVIEDHSHDLLAPQATTSRAEYAFASLRKTLPIPDGGVVWSPRDLPVPAAPDVTPHHAAAVGQRLSAMILKHHYLSGDPMEKQLFRDAAVESERMMASGPLTGISPYSQARIHTLPAGRWRRRRAANLATLRARLGEISSVRVLDVPFAATLFFQSERTRESVRRTLIANDVYPSVLWTLEEPAVDGIPAAHIDASRRVLSIPVDHRYGDDEMRRVADILKNALDVG